MAFSVQKTVVAGVSIFETYLTNALTAVGGSVGAAVPVFGAIKAVFEGIVSVVAAYHASTVNLFNGYQVADLPFKDEQDLLGTEAVRQFARQRYLESNNGVSSPVSNGRKPVNLSIKDRLMNLDKKQITAIVLASLLAIAAVYYLVKNRSIFSK